MAYINGKKILEGVRTIPVAAGLYEHNISIVNMTSEFYCNVKIVNNSSTPINSFQLLYNWLDAQGYDDVNEKSYQATGYDGSEMDGVTIFGIANDGGDIYYIGQGFDSTEPPDFDITSASGSFTTATYTDVVRTL